MKKLTLDLDSLCVETFAITPEQSDAGFILDLPSRRGTCIEQCTTSCVP